MLRDHLVTLKDELLKKREHSLFLSITLVSVRDTLVSVRDTLVSLRDTLVSVRDTLVSLQSSSFKLKEDLVKLRVVLLNVKEVRVSRNVSPLHVKHMILHAILRRIRSRPSTDGDGKPDRKLGAPRCSLNARIAVPRLQPR